jgi:uncharacterized protein YndB with AHSA1/START domain
MSTPSSFTIERIFKAPREKVWNMWTTKEGLEKWFGPNTMIPKVTKLDVRVGGEYEVILEQGEMKILNHGVYTEVDPTSRLAYNWHFDIFLAPGEKPYDVPVTIELQEVPDGTKMIYTQGDLATPDATEGSRQGYLEHFERFAKIVEEGS